MQLMFYRTDRSDWEKKKYQLYFSKGLGRYVGEARRLGLSVKEEFVIIPK